jgi:hypothetical protein
MSCGPHFGLHAHIKDAPRFLPRAIPWLGVSLYKLVAYGADGVAPFVVGFGCSRIVALCDLFENLPGASPGSGERESRVLPESQALPRRLTAAKPVHDNPAFRSFVSDTEPETGQQGIPEHTPTGGRRLGVRDEQFGKLLWHRRRPQVA